MANIQQEYTRNGNGQNNGSVKMAEPIASGQKKERDSRVVIVSLCLMWYIVSSSNNVIGKMVFNRFPFPMTVTMVQLASITLYSGPFFNLWGIRKYVDIPRRYYLRIIVPLALGKFLASVTAHISLSKLAVSYAHTGKSVNLGEIPHTHTRLYLHFLHVAPVVGLN